MNNLIDYKVDSSKILQTARKNSQCNKNIVRGFLSFFVLAAILVAATFYTANQNKAQAVEFGLGNDYEQIIALNNQFSDNVPLAIDSITTTSVKGDKRVVALYIFLEKYKSPMASPAVAKAFIDGADKNGFGDQWTLLPAISGIESAFGKLIPYHGSTLSYNGWGWSGGSKYGRYTYFESWEDAATKISAGVAKGYGAKLSPEKMMATYCPPCALPENKGRWAKTVNRYIQEMNEIYESL